MWLYSRRFLCTENVQFIPAGKDPFKDDDLYGGPKFEGAARTCVRASPPTRVFRHLHISVLPCLVLKLILEPLAGKCAPVCVLCNDLFCRHVRPSELDEGLKQSFVEYLEELHVNDDLSYFILAYAKEKEQREYLGWLNGLAEFYGKILPKK